MRAIFREEHCKRGQYKPMHQFWKKIGVPYSHDSPNTAKVDKIPFHFSHPVQISTYGVGEWRL